MTPVSRRLLIAASAALLLAPGAALAGTPKPVDFTPGAAADTLSGYTKLMNKVAPDATVVHIPTFRVEVVREMSKSAEARGGGGTATQMSTYRLDGLHEAAAQGMTQRLYDALVADLTARGYKVATPAETAADPDIAPLMAGAPTGMIQPSADGQSSFYAPAGLSVTLSAVDLRAAKSNDPGAAMAAFGSMGALMKRMTTAGKATARGAMILEPKYTVSFGALTNDNQGFMGRMSDTASVSASVNLRIVEEGTRIDVIQKKGGGMTTNAAFLTNPLKIQAAALTSPVDATTGDQRAGMAGAALVSFAAQSAGLSGSSVRMTTKSVRPTPVFLPASRDTLTAVQGALVARIMAGQ